MPSTTRRHLIMAVSALPPVGFAAAVPALGASHPDVDLIAACGRFLELERQIVAYFKACPPQQGVGFQIGRDAKQAAHRLSEAQEGEQDAILARAAT